MVTSEYGQFVNDAGKKWTIRIVAKDDRYGLGGTLKHDSEDPLVEFYDADNKVDGELGYFVARYYLSTLFDDAFSPPFGTVAGLALVLDVPTWSIDLDTCVVIADWLMKSVNTQGRTPEEAFKEAERVLKEADEKTQKKFELLKKAADVPESNNLRDAGLKLAAVNFAKAYMTSQEATDALERAIKKMEE